MTTTYDPTHHRYFDEADVREELTRVYDLCHGCRLCFNLCPAFPTLFDFVDGHDGRAEAMTPAEQDRVVDECYQCKLCYVKCPYIPPHEWALDFPRLMLRADATRKREHAGLRERVTDRALGQTDLVGRVSSAMAPLANRVVTRPGSLPRRLMERTVGIASERLLPPYVRQRFTTWFKKRSAPPVTDPQARVAVFPTCLVEYQAASVGRDLVRVYERNRVDCTLADAGCCGAPFLHAGDIAKFTRQARQTLGTLAAAVREGRDVVVPQPTCGYTLKRDYPLYLADDPDAELVAAYTYDAAEYLTDLDRQEGRELDREFGGEVPETVVYHVPCHLQAQNVGLRSRDLMALTGTRVQVVNKCSGIDGTWGYRAENYELSKQVGAKLARDIEATGAEVIVGDCHLANGGIAEETGRTPLHPFQVMARAYGIPDDGEEQPR